MKRLFLLIITVLIFNVVSAQTGTGWAQQRSKVNFKDSINIAKGWMIDGTIVLPSVAEINFLDGVSSALQSQINLKANLASPTFTGTVTLPSSTSIGDVSSTEIGYVNGVTGAVQTQLDARKYMPYDFLIEEVAGTTYARPNPNTAYTASSNAVPSVVINAVMAQLTTGGIIQFSAGTFDNCDSIVVPYDNITWRGSGRNKTILKLKASFDVGKTVSDGFIQVIEKDNFTIMDLEIDGNGANQTKIDVGASAGLAIICGVESEDTRYLTIDNCYIHDFTQTGVFSSGCDFLTVKNSHIKDNYWNGITFGWGTDLNVVENCLVEGGGDVGVALYGRNNKILNSTIRYVTGTHGFDNSQVSISLEVAGDDPYVRSQYHQIVNNMIKGAGQNAGIVSNAIGEGSLGVTIQGNYIDSCGVAISMMGDSSQIIGNKIVKPQGETYNYGILIQDGDYNFVSANDITCRTIGSGDYPILLTNTSDGADYNKIVGNNLFGGTYYSIGVGHANCDGNIIMGNVFDDVSGGGYDIYDIGTGTIKSSDNYDIHSARFNPVVTGANSIGASGGYGVTLNTTGATSVTLPTSGTLLTTANISSEIHDTILEYMPQSSLETYGIVRQTPTGGDGLYDGYEVYVYDVDEDGEIEELEAAIIALRDKEYSKIILATGTYKITNAINLTGDDDLLEIDGSNSLIVVPNGYTGDAINITAASSGLNNIKIRNLKLSEVYDGGRDCLWNAIAFDISYYVQMSTFENISIGSCNNVIDVTLTGSGWMNANNFNNIDADTFVKFLHQDRDFETLNDYFDGNNFVNIQAQATGITTHFVDSIYMQNCNFINCTLWDASSSDTAFLMTEYCSGNNILGGDYGSAKIIDPNNGTKNTILLESASSINADTLTIGENLRVRGYGSTGPDIKLYNSYTTIAPVMGISHHGESSHTNFFGETLSTEEVTIGAIGRLKIGTKYTTTPVSLYINSLEKLKLYYAGSSVYATDINTNVNISGKLDIAQISGSLTDGTPTDAEIDTATGTTPATATAGWKVIIKDSDGSGLLYLVESDGTNWFYVVMTKAL